MQHLIKEYLMNEKEMILLVREERSQTGVRVSNLTKTEHQFYFSKGREEH